MANWRDKFKALGLVQTTVTVPLGMEEAIQATAERMRVDAGKMMASDHPNEDMILEIHRLVREKGLPLPVEAFRSRLDAQSWLIDHMNS